MAEGRMVKREIAKSKKIAFLKNEKARSLYFMIYPHTDIEGRHSADPYDIKAECIPLFNWNIKAIEKALKDLHDCGLIILYEENGIWLEIIRFHDFQRIDRKKEAPTKIPSPPKVLQSTPEYSPISKEKLSKGKLSKDMIKINYFIPFLLINQFKEAYEDYLAMRASLKYIITERSEKMRLKKLSSYDVSIAIKMLDNAVNGGWKDVFPLKPEDPVSRRVNAKNAKRKQKKKMDDFTKSKPLSDDQMIAAYKESKMPMPPRLRKRAKELEKD